VGAEHTTIIMSPFLSRNIIYPQIRSQQFKQIRFYLPGRPFHVTATAYEHTLCNMDWRYVKLYSFKLMR